jgi:hypothetical protein
MRSPDPGELGGNRKSGQHFRDKQSKQAKAYCPTSSDASTTSNALHADCPSVADLAAVPLVAGSVPDLTETEIDIASTRAFLDRLSVHIGKNFFTFQTFDDSGLKRLYLIRVLHGSLSEHVEQLTTLNSHGAGIFVTVNFTDGKGRKRDNVLQIRALFVDLDGAPLAPVLEGPLRPHIVIESSPGKWHAYWLVADLPLDQFKSLQQALAARFGGDPKVCDLPRVMRLPGFLHRKTSPVQTQIVQMERHKPYSAEEACKAFGAQLGNEPGIQRATALSARAGTKETIPEGERNSTLFGHAIGFARRGHSQREIRRRLETMNAERCAPPLSCDDVRTIAVQATSYGSNGFTAIPNALLDSTEWRNLPPAAKAIATTAYRRHDGYNDGRIALPWSDFADQKGLRHSGAFYTLIKRLTTAGILVCTQPAKVTQHGKSPALFGFGSRFKPLPPKERKTQHAEEEKHALLDRQTS